MHAHTDHAYKAVLVWQGNLGTGTSTYQGYGRSWNLRTEGKPDLTGSADPAFRGNPALHNPEDLLVAVQGGGTFESVSLHPRVRIADPGRMSLAKELHEKAHTLCFIASSVCFPVLHEAVIESR
jgi:organic hydroperoxide reductase OsmC/OhrA